VKGIAIDLMLWILASPVYATLAVRRVFRNYRFLRVASVSRIRCRCGADISLVGVWRCSCSHWVDAGHLLQSLSDLPNRALRGPLP